jgi:hypothetical protein
MNQQRLFRLLWLSVAAAVATISLKTTAWLLTGSVGMLSDAAESVVNLVAAVVAILALALGDQARRRGARIRPRQGRILLRRGRRHLDPGGGGQHRDNGRRPAAEPAADR